MSITIPTALIQQLREATGAKMVHCKEALVEAKGDMEEAKSWLRKKGMASASKKTDRSAGEGAIAVSVMRNHGIMLEVNCETDFVARNQHFQHIVYTWMDKLLSLSDAYSYHSFTNEKSFQEDLLETINRTGENVVFRRAVEMRVEEGAVVPYVHTLLDPSGRKMLGKIGVLIALESKASKEALEDIGKKIAMHVAASKPDYLSIDEVPASVIENEKEIFNAQMANEKKPPAVIEKMLSGKIKKFFDQTVLEEQPFILENSKTVKEYIQEQEKHLGFPIILKAMLRFTLGEGIIA